MIRLLVEVPAPPPPRLVVRGERLHYLAHVLRLGPGATLEVFDGKGRAFDAEVVSVDADHAELALGAEREAVAGGELLLLQALPKGDKLELILQKGTELGITRFLPVATARAVVKLEPGRAEHKAARWRKIVEEAARQCGRADVPTVDAPTSLLEGAGAIPPGTTLLILDEEERTTRLATALPPSGPVALAIGPEGGWDRDEVEALRKRGGVPVSLGVRILRTETASLAAAAVILHRRGDLG